MNEVVMTADSTCDLSDELIKKHNVSIIPLYINKDGGFYRDRIEITPNDIFDYYRETHKLTTTSAPSVEDYIEFFKPIVKQGKKIVHLPISSHFSASYQNACIAKKEIGGDDVYVVDSKSLSTGIALIVLKGCELIKKGLSADKIYDYLTNVFVDKIEASFVINSLTYLHKGGRCSSVAKLGSNLLKLKPCIELSDGKMHVGKKYRGNFSKCIFEYVDDRLNNRTDLDKNIIFVTHASCEQNLVNDVVEQIKSKHIFENIYITQAGCTISNHCGPNTLGIIFVRK